jgi:hypothetical protein
MESPEISELRALAAQHEKLQKSIQSARTKLQQMARTQGSQRGVAERNAMLLEDCLNHAPSELKMYYVRSLQNISVEEARSALLTFLRAEEGGSREYQELRGDIDDMMNEIATQQKLLNAEETAISQLRESEMVSRRKEDELYETLMEQVHHLSNQYQLIRRENQVKKRQLTQLRQSNADLRKCVEQTQAEILKGNEQIEYEQEESRKLRGRKQIAQNQQIKIQELESEQQDLNVEKERLLREEMKMEERVNELSVKFGERRDEWFLLKAGLNRDEDEVDRMIGLNKRETGGK